MKRFLNFIPSFLICVLYACSQPESKDVKSEITKWPDNKTGAISITFDDGIINQLTIAKPIL
ncbi:hypothetical protein AAGF08_11815, partial [Algoriphagus sp. SE2]|uniref:hypothetical protein n=1 Tax=Algoriphagus sp. SE2 TaxID=3141536 RepID=UPI0031CD41F7